MVKARSQVGQTCFFFAPAAARTPPPDAIPPFVAVAELVVEEAEEEVEAEGGAVVGDARVLCVEAGEAEEVLEPLPEDEGGGGGCCCWARDERGRACVCGEASGLVCAEEALPLLGWWW